MISSWVAWLITGLYVVCYCLMIFCMVVGFLVVFLWFQEIFISKFHHQSHLVDYYRWRMRMKRKGE